MIFFLLSGACNSMLYIYNLLKKNYDIKDLLKLLKARKNLLCKYNSDDECSKIFYNFFPGTCSIIAPYYIPNIKKNRKSNNNLQCKDIVRPTACLLLFRRITN